MASAKLLALFHLSVLLLTSFTALAYNEEVSFAQSTHYTHPSHPPAAAPMPHHHHKGGHNHHHHPPTEAPMPGHHHKGGHNPHPHPKPPTQPPLKPPTPPPTKPSTPPAKAPTPPPKYPPKPPMVNNAVAIQGVVYCKGCKYTGVDTLTGATALANATVKIVCIKDKFHMVQKTTTDKNGYFYMLPKKLTTAGISICKVVLAKSPSAKCSVPTNLHGGLKGAQLIPPSPTKTSVPSKIALFTVGPFAYETPKKCY